jgi:hypothetical protein
MKRNQSIEAAPRVQSEQCCVVFDPTDGKIRHIHEVVTLEGAEAVPDYEVEQRALSLAAQVGLDTSLDTSLLKTIHIDPEELTPGERYAVDPDTMTLVHLAPSYGDEERA